jgi:hypothetical protein
MRTVRPRPAIWVVLFALIVSACANANPQSSPKSTQGTPPTSNGNADEDADAGSSFDNLDVVDPSLNGKVAILRVGSALGDNNLLAVFAGLKNRTSHRLALEVETIYKDKDGNALNAGSWITVTLKPHEERDYRSTSISELAVDFLIRVRRASGSK